MGDPAVRDARVALLIESDGPGGAEAMVAALAGALDRAGASVAVFYPAHGEGWLASRLHGTRVRLEAVETAGPWPMVVWRVIRRLRALRVSLAHSHEFGMAVIGAIAAMSCGIPHCITMHGSTYYRQRRLRRWLLRLAVGRSRGVVAVGHRIAEALTDDLQLRPGRVVTIPNGVAPPAPPHPTLKAELGLGPGDVLLVAIGNLYPVKGHRYLVEALRRLGDAHPTTHVAIAGRGECAGALRAEAARVGLSDRVHLLGLRPDVGDLLAAADLVVHPSLSEGLPLAVLEAMHAAKPIVATAVGDVPEVLAHGAAGALVPPGDSGALAQAIDRLLSDTAQGRRLAHAAAGRGQARYSLDRMARDYDDLYQRALAGVVTASAGRAATHEAESDVRRNMAS